MTIHIPFQKRTNDISTNELNNLLMRGSFKGLGVARLSRALSKNPNLNLIYDRDTQTFYYENGKKALHLIKLEKRSSTLASRFHSLKCRFECYRKPHEVKIQNLSNKLFQLASQKKSASFKDKKIPISIERLDKMVEMFSANGGCKVNNHKINVIDSDVIIISDLNSPPVLSDLIFNKDSFSQEWFEQLPDEQKERLHFFVELPIFVSKYNSDHIEILPRSLQTHPTYHLHQFVKMNSPSFRVSFLDEHLNTTEALGASLAKQYLTDLVSNLVKIDAFSPMPSSLKLPHGKAFQLNKSEKRFFYNFGRLLRFFYKSDEDVTGVYFDDVLFKGIQSLSKKEINTSFETLPLQSHINLCKVITKSLNTSTDLKMNTLENHFSEILDLALWQPGQPLPEDNILSWAALLINKDDYRDELDIPDVSKIKNNIEEFVKDLPQGIFDHEINNVCLGSMLAPIHSIATGLGSRIINEMKNRDIQELSQWIQGSIDRNLIAESIEIECSTPHIIRKVKWLKEWIKDPSTTDQEVKQFLVFATGSPTSSAINIRMQYSNFTPVPISHACFKQLEFAPMPCGNSMCNDRTKEAFVAMLKKFVLVDNQDFNQM